jgi:hypothetical protein
MREPIFKFCGSMTGVEFALLVATGFAWFVWALSLSWGEGLMVVVAFAGMLLLAWAIANGR